MKKLISISIITLFFMFSACKESTSSSSNADWGKEYSQKLCKKVVECTSKMLDKMPKSIRKMAAKSMPTVESCSKDYPMSSTEESAVKFTPTEIADAKKCIKAIVKADCKVALTMQAPGCETFKNKMMQMKKKK